MMELAVRKAQGRIAVASMLAMARVRNALVTARDEKGQGTTEYAILVGVLVVIAVVAVTSFRGKIQELWTLISEGINGL